jgi:hypothetical protein
MANIAITSVKNWMRCGIVLTGGDFDLLYVYFRIFGAEK